VSGQASRWSAALVIVTATAACDNVEWGGAEVRLRHPPPAHVGAARDTTAAGEDPSTPELPAGPVLYIGSRDSTGVTLSPVGEILEDSIAPFRGEDEVPGYRAAFVRELLPVGTEFLLFAEGTRVGSFTSESVETDESFCVPRPAVRGIAEFLPEAMDHQRFLAVPREHAGGGRRAFEEPTPERDARDASLGLAAEIIPQVGAEWPGDLLNIRWDLQAFRPDAEGPPLFTVTYLFRDRLRVEPTVPSAYALFIMGVPRGGSFEQGYVWYREAAREGKGAPHFWEQFDWDGDGQTEVLLEVLGETGRWTAALDRRSGPWERVFQDPCGAAAPPVVASG